MPLYSIQGPDGKTYEIEGPAGATREQVIDAIQYKLTQQPQATPSAPFSMGDLFASFGRGAAGSTKALTDVFGADNAVSDKLEGVSKGLEERMTPARRAELQRQAERSKRAAESGSMWQEIKAAATNIGEAPLQAAAEGVGSFVPYLPALLATPAAAALGLGARAVASVNTVAKFAPRVIATAQGAGSVKGSIYDAVYEAERRDGVSDEEAKDKARKAQEYLGSNIDQILLGSGLGYVAGSSGVERLLTKEGVQKAAPGMARRVGRALAEEVPTEFLQGGQEQLAANLALQRTGRDVPTMQGVVGQATQEGLMAALSAGPVAAVRSPREYLAEQERAKRAEEQAAALRQAEADAAQQAEYRKTPEYLDDLERRYAELRKTEEALALAAKGKPDPNDPLAVEEKRRAQEALTEFRQGEDYIGLREEYTQAFDALRPRIAERKRQARVEAAPENTQLDLMGEPQGVQDQSLPGQLKALEKYAGAFDAQIKQAKKAGDAQQVALLQQKQAQAREQIGTLLPDMEQLGQARALAERQLEDFQTQINDLAAQPQPQSDIEGLQEQLAQLTAQLQKVPEQAALVAPNARPQVQQRLETQLTAQINQVQAEIAQAQKPAQPDYAQLEQLSARATQLRNAIAEIDKTQQLVTKYKPVDASKPVDKDARLKELDTTLKKQAELGEDVSKTLAKIKETQALQEQPDLFGEADLRPVQSRDLADIMADERERLAALNKKFEEERAALQKMAATPLQSPELQWRKQEKLKEVRQLADDVRRRNQTLVDIERLQQLQSNYAGQLLGYQSKNQPVPEQLTKRLALLRRDIDTLTTQLKGSKPEAQGQTQLAQALPDSERGATESELTQQRDRDIAALLDKFLPPALGVTETKETLNVQGPEGERPVTLTTLGGTRPITATEVDDVIDQREAMVEAYENEFLPAVDAAQTDAARREAVRNGAGVKANVADLVLVEIDQRRKRAGGSLLDNSLRNDVVELVNAVLDRNAPVVPGATPGEQIDNLITEFLQDAAQPGQAATKPQGRRVTGPAQPALDGVTMLEQLKANRSRLAQLNRDIQYAGRPSDPEKAAARDALVQEREDLKAQSKELQARYNALQQKEGPFQDSSEVGEMRAELAKLDQAIKSGQFKENPRALAQMQTARDELQGRIAAAVGPMPRPEAPPRERQLPGMGNLFGQFTPQAPTPEALTKAKTAYVAATQKVEDIRKALARLDEMGPKYFQEVATTYQQNIENASSERTRLDGRIERLEEQLEKQIALNDALPEDKRAASAYAEQIAQIRADLNTAKADRARTERRSKELEQTQAEVTKFLNLAKLAGVGKGDLRANLERAMEQATQDVETKKQAMADLEKRQRMAEQQNAAQRGLELGDVEAEKITSGQGKGYVTPRGKALDTKPKSKRSWIVSQDSKASVPKPNQAGKMEAASQNAAAVLANRPALERYLNDLQAELAKWQEQGADTESLAAQKKLLQQIDAVKKQLANPLLEEAKQATATATAALKGAPTAENLQQIKNALERLEREINAHYTPAQAAEITKEMALLQERLAEFPVAADVKDVAATYQKAIETKRGLPAAERVAQMMFTATQAETKAAAALKQAEDSVQAAQGKYDAAVKSVKAAEQRLAKAKNPAQQRGLQLHIDNVYGSAQSLRDGISDAEQEQKKAEQAYMVARLERLTLVQQMGEHAKAEAAKLTERLKGAADTVASLEAERNAALEREDKIRSKLTAAEAAAEKAAEDAKAAKIAARNKAQIDERNARNAALDAATKARERAEAARTGSGLPATSVERDTAGQLGTALQAEIKKRLAAAETNLAKAMQNGTAETIRMATQKVQDIATELDQVYAKAPRKVTRTEGDSADLLETRQKLVAANQALREASARGDTEAARKLTDEIEALKTLEEVYAESASSQPAPVAGVRSGARREGPAVRYTRGGSKAIMQAGQVKLRAAGLSQQAANAISAYVKKNQIAGAKTEEAKAARQAEYDALTADMTPEQVSELLAEGKRLMGLGPTAELIAKRAAYQDALTAVARAEQAVKDAKTGVTKELARDELELAQQRSDAAERAYALAKDMYEMSMVKTAKKAQRETVEALLEDVENVAASRTSAAIDSADDLYGTRYADMTVSPINSEMDDALRDGRLADVLNMLAKEGSNDLLRRNAAALSKFVFKTKVVFQPNLTMNGERVPAYYNATQNTIFFDANTDIAQEDVVHEATHAATLYGLKLPSDRLTKEQQVAKNELMAMWRTLGRDKALADQYGMDSLEEFASEIQSNQAFRDAIGDRQWRGGSFLRRVFNLLLELIGMRRPELLTDKAEKYISDLYMQSRKITAEKLVVATKSRGSVLVADDSSKLKELESNLYGYGFRVQYVDRLDAADAALVKAEQAGKLSSLEAENAQYFMRLADQVTQGAGQFITSGPVRFAKDRVGSSFEERYEAATGANLINVAESIESAAKTGLGSADEVETILTVLVAGARANATASGWQRLAGDKAAQAKAEYEAYKRRVDANPEAKKHLDNAMAEYKAYNDGLITFVEQSGYLSKAVANELRGKPYVPFYRVVKDEVRLYVDNANWVRIGDLKNNPDLKQFLGSGEKIMPILTSAVQNTFMLTRAAMHNKGTHETASALFKAGFASKFGAGRGPDNPSTVRFKVKGEDYFAVIDSDAFGIPADLIVKGMEGLKVATPELVKLMGIPANWVRKFVTRGPAYIFRQLVREPLQAAIVQGVDGVPVLNALRQMAKMRAGRSPAEDALMRGLVVSSNIYTGDEQDMQMFLRDLSTGKGKWDKLMGKLDTLALQVDASTRATIYEDSLRKGLTQRQAQMRAFESQNFSRRGLSPSIQMLRTVVPFFNAQIQGLDVLYRAMRGRLPFEEKLKLRDTMMKRGLLLMVTALGYALAMREDEKYMEQPPEVRYGNFLFKVPGVDDYLKVPIPYEVGILFKALPEAILDAAINDTEASEAAKAIGKLFWQSAPGVVPVAAKPWVEAALNQTLYGPIEDQRMQNLPADQRYREETPEVLKSLGSVTGTVDISPRMLEHFASSYGSSLLLSLLRIPDALLRDPAEGDRPSAPASKLAFVGGLFQSGESRFPIDRAYAEMEKITQAVKGYEDLLKRGRRADAEAFAQRFAAQLDAGSMAGTFRQRMGEMFSAEREIRLSPDLTAQQKDAMIKEIKAAQRQEAKEFYAAVGQTRRQ